MRLLIGIILIFFVTLMPGPSAVAEMVAAQTSHDFGEIGPDKKLEHLFSIVNSGNVEMKIERVKSACSCTASVLSGKLIEPGREGLVRVIFDPSGYSGKFEKYLEVFFEGKDEPLLLSVRGVVGKNFNPDSAPKISVSVSAIDLGLMGAGEDKGFSLVIQNDGKGDLYIRNFKAGREGDGVSLDQSPIAAGKKIEASFLYHAKEPGPIDDYLLIVSNDPIVPNRYVPIKGEVLDEW